MFAYKYDIEYILEYLVCPQMVTVSSSKYSTFKHCGHKKKNLFQNWQTENPVGQKVEMACMADCVSLMMMSSRYVKFSGEMYENMIPADNDP